MTRAARVGLATTAIAVLIVAAARFLAAPIAPLTRSDRRSLTFERIANGAHLPIKHGD
jgi:hypothetical protein